MHAVRGKGKIEVRPGKHKQPNTQGYHAEYETQPHPGFGQQPEDEFEYPE
jgi:hypothetical protein